MPRPARPQEYDEDQHVERRVDDEQALALMVGKHGKAEEREERQQEQEKPVALELGVAVVGERIRNGIEPRPARRVLEGDLLGLRLPGRRRIGTIEQIVQALRHPGAAAFVGCQRRRFPVELPGERDQHSERLPGLELAPLRVGQFRPAVRALDAEQPTDKSDDVVAPPLEGAAAIVRDDGVSPAFHRDRVGRRGCLLARRHHVDNRPDLGCVEARPRRAAHIEGNAFTGEFDDLGGTAGRHVGFVAVPDRDQGIAVPGDEQADRAVLLGPLLPIGAHRLQ